MNNQNGDIYIADILNNRIRKVYNTVGVKNVIPTIEVKAYPNPAKDNLTIEQAAGSEVQIFDLSGKSVLQIKLNTNKENLEIGTLMPGAYLMEFTNESGEKKTVRLVISK